MIPFFGYAIALARLQSAVRLHRAVVVRARDVSRHRRLWRGGDVGRARRQSRSSWCSLAVMLAAALIALPIGLLCVRYVGIFFGMLTLAFGMLFHSFLFKFYHVTGGDSGMRVPRMNILGLDFRQLQQDRVSCRAVLLLLPRAAADRRLRDVADRAFALRPASQGDPRQCRARPNISACTCAASGSPPS